MRSVSVPPAECAEAVWEGNMKAVDDLVAAQMNVAKIILLYNAPSDAAELGIQSRRLGRDARKLEWQQYRMHDTGEEKSREYI